jgi:hypothetical protein
MGMCESCLYDKSYLNYTPDEVIDFVNKKKIYDNFHKYRYEKSSFESDYPAHFLNNKNYGWKWFSTKNGSEWLSTTYGKCWFYDKYSNMKEWLSTDDGNEWFLTKNNPYIISIKIMYMWLETENGRGYLQSEKGNKFVGSEHGKKWLVSNDGNEWLREKENGQKWLMTDDGSAWLLSDDGKKWLVSNDGKIWLTTDFAWIWVSNKGYKWFCSSDFTGMLCNYYGDNRYYSAYLYSSKNGVNYFSTEILHKWIYENNNFLHETDYLLDNCGKKWLETDYGQKWLKSDHGQYWLASSKGNNFLLTEYGQKYLESNYGQIWLETSYGQNWLASSGGNNFLLTDYGQRWLKTENGIEWLGKVDGFEFLLTEGGIKFIENNVYWLQCDDGRRFKRYIENCADKDPKFMTTYFAKMIYKKGFEEYFFPKTKHDVPLSIKNIDDHEKPFVGYVVSS